MHLTRCNKSSNTIVTFLGTSSIRDFVGIESSGENINLWVNISTVRHEFKLFEQFIEHLKEIHQISFHEFHQADIFDFVIIVLFPNYGTCMLKHVFPMFFGLYEATSRYLLMLSLL